jgi:hypothetical protein
MEKEFVPFELALKLKAIGFDEPCFGRYYYKESYPMLNPNSGETELVFEFGQYIKQTEITILAPLYQQAFRWFREKYGAHSSPRKYDETQWWAEWGSWTSFVFETFEEAELAWLNKLIEIVEGIES